MEKESKMHQVEIDYTFNAPREKVFEAWTKKESLSEWFAPEGCTFKSKKLEIRQGGTFHYCISNPNVGDCWCIGVYNEIKVPEKIVYTIANADENGNKINPETIGMDPEWPGETLVSISFIEKDGKTIVTLKQTVSETIAKRTGAHPSWIQMLKKLEFFVINN
jgi:uncharacterized protein YndB with AHSA1/START domain